MRMLIKLLVLSILTAIPADAGSLIIQNPLNGHWYQRIDDPLSWQDAQANAIRLGGYLATITDQNEQDFLWNNLGSAINDFIWLGGTDEAQEGTWVWVTGETFWLGTLTGNAVGGAYQNWGSTSGQLTEPDNIGGGQDYLAFFAVSYGHNGGWDDFGLPDYNHLKPGIIEWETNPSVSPVPEPSLPVLLGLGLIGVILSWRYSKTE